MKRIDFVTLRLFVSVADARSLTRAAEREHMALAAVSKRISDLETHLDTTLLYRRPRGVELTPAGDALLHHARHVMESLQQLNADLSEYSTGIRGHVRIHANTSAVIEFLPEDLSAFTRENPQIKIDLEERLSSEIVHAVREGLTDIGIFAGHIPVDGLQTFDYRCDRLVLVTPAEHPLATKPEVSLVDTLSYDFIGLQQDASLHRLLVDYSQRLGRMPRLRIQVRSFEGICRMIHHGMGIGVLPEKSVRSHLATLDLRIVPISDEWAHRELRIGVRHYDSLSLISRQMVDHLTRSANTNDEQA